MRLLPELHPSASAILDERKADRIGWGDVPEGQPRRACSAKYGRGNRRGSCCQRGDGCSLVAQNFNEAAAASGQEMVRTNSAHPDSQLRHFSIHRYACLMNIKKSQVLLALSLVERCLVR